MSLQWKQYRACCRCREQQAGSRNRDQSAVEVAVVEAGEEVKRHTGSERPVVHSAVLTHCADRRWHTHTGPGDVTDPLPRLSVRLIPVFVNKQEVQEQSTGSVP